MDRRSFVRSICATAITAVAAPSVIAAACNSNQRVVETQIRLNEGMEAVSPYVETPDGWRVSREWLHAPYEVVFLINPKTMRPAVYAR